MSALVNTYKLFLRPDNNLILFVCYGGRHYSDSTRVIYEAMLKDSRFSGYKIYWAFTSPEKYPFIPNRVNINSLKYFNIALRARCWISNVIVERALNFKGINTFYLHTTHGILCKLDGKDSIDSQNFKTLSKEQKWDCCLASSEFEKYVYAGMFGIPVSRMKVIGMPKNDILVNHTKEYRNEIRKKLGIPEGKTAILYAPTFREEANFKEVFDVDVDLWQKTLGPNFVLLYRAHPVVSSGSKNISDFFIDVTNYEVVEDIMIAADILVSDYSGIIFDYCIMEKPIFLWTYDYDKYNKIRGLYFDIRKELPSKEKQEDLVRMIKDSNYSENVSKYVVPFKNKYETEYGNATSQSLDIIYDNIKIK
ncbi:MAG: CDP-glycerol glycerophosphotransferase family protein [Pseudobutyrivibrio sp.]|nr:CDP-glycerol glycerophosphotransferase family protein [Pseudobutyrivibrio sp.]